MHACCALSTVYCTTKFLTLNLAPLRGQSAADTDAFMSGLLRQNMPVQPFADASIDMLTWRGSDRVSH